MKKKLIIIGSVLLILLAAALIVPGILKNSTKKHSPEEIVKFSKSGANIEVFYNRPYKKERVIFGELVPYDETWRTGANEATTFETSKDIKVGGKKLKKGKYTLWTVPGEDNWEIVFNTKMYGWGVSLSLDPKSQRETEFDELIVTVPVQKENQVLEQFTISFQELANSAEMILAWDQVSVPVFNCCILQCIYWLKSSINFFFTYLPSDLIRKLVYLY